MTRLGRFGMVVGWCLVLLAYLAVAWQQARYGIEYDEGTGLNVISNLALGNGYATTGLSWGWYVPFDSGASTGPAVLLPSSLMWWLTDGSLWAARLVPLCLFAILPVSLGFLFYRVGGAWGSLIAAASPLLLAVGLADISTVSLVPGRFVGEFAGAAFLASLALALDRRWYLVAGLASGLAVLSKFNFLLAVFVAVGTWLVLGWIRRSGMSLRAAARLAVGFIAPLAAFEVFKLTQLGASGYVAHSKAYVWYLLNQGGDYPSAPLSEKIPSRLGGLIETLGPLSVLLLLGLILALALLAGRQSRVAFSSLRTGPIILVTVGVSIVLWWVVSAPQDSPRLGIPALLLLLPVVVVAGYGAILGQWSPSADRASLGFRLVAVSFCVFGLLVVAYQGAVAARNDFGARLLADQEGASAALRASGTPSLPNVFIWNLGQFQLLSGIPSETKPGVSAPTVKVFDSIQARYAAGKDDAREMLSECGEVLFTSQGAVVCRPPALAGS